jgi:CspA family cold shock protein
MSQRVTGHVKWFNSNKGFGFIELGEGNDVFVHFGAIIGDGYLTLNKGQLVEFRLVDGPKGLHAEEVVKIDHSAEKDDTTNDKQ